MYTYKRLMTRIFFLSLIATQAFAQQGLTSLPSAFSVEETMQRLESAVLEKGLRVMARIDHAQGAASVDISLRPTQLLIFGNPRVGAPVMQCQQRVAIDLPQKALVWEDAQGQVWLSYNAPDYLAKRHDISGCKAYLDKIAKALKGLGSHATQSP